MRRTGRELLPLSIRMDITSLIDIVFLLLVFFMLTSSFSAQSGVQVHLPRAVTADIRTRENLTITISSGNLLHLGERIVTLRELRERLEREAGGQRPILIRADKTAALGRVVEVWDLCRTLGITQVNIATQESGEGGF
ncbi:MAG: hypothetical protein COV76_05610 [Candidatus Omnitrophica bacterium CG11_big_fil_rev_8_21_14_0_20_64_10]|nr:MAG: hypothetical protein COV76_05610 [Candidatus Omnitrophica bacterium CG11_big_fil_rev_8_21_14_0_20_64_10]